MSHSSARFDVVVVGAGAVGTACALSLHKASPRLRIAIVERGLQQPLTEAKNDRVWALGPAALSLLADLNIEGQLDQQSHYPYQHMVVWDENSDGQLEFHAADLGREQLGAMVDAERITALLQAAASAAPGITMLFERQLDSTEWLADQVMLKSKEHEPISTSLVVAADGANSWLRKQAVIPTSSFSYHQRGVVAKIQTERSHQDTAWQRFLGSGPIAVLPLADNHSSIVWSASEEQAKELLECESAEFEQRLGLVLERRLGEVSLAGPRLSFPLQSRQAERYVDDRLALIGDAAHSIHPLAGQGANLGFQDVIALTSVLESCNDPADSAALRRYQRMRRPANLQTDWLMTSLHFGYQFNNPIWTLLRGKGMNLISDTPAIKNWLAKEAMGLGVE